MKVFYASHDGIWLYGYSVIVAKNKEQAKSMLEDELRVRNLKINNIDLHEVDTSKVGVTMLWNGDY